MVTYIVQNITERASIFALKAKPRLNTGSVSYTFRLLADLDSHSNSDGRGHFLDDLHLIGCLYMIVWQESSVRFFVGVLSG